MRKVFLPIAILILIGVGVLVFGVTSKTTTNTATQNVNATTNATNTNSASALPTNTNTATNTASNAATTPSSSSVIVTARGFSPQGLSVQKGTTVTWTNGSGRQVYIAPDTHPSHTKYRGVWDDDGKGDIANGETSSVTFGTVGTFTYHNHVNPSQTGTITVTE